MFRRQFATAIAALAAPAIVSAGPTEYYTGPEVAQMIADWVFEDGDWQEETFFHHFECPQNATAVVIAGLNVKRMFSFLVRVEAAVESGLMPEVLGAGNAAPESEEELFPVVIVFLVDTDGFNRAMGMFAEFFAQWPRAIDETMETVKC